MLDRGCVHAFVESDALDRGADGYMPVFAGNAIDLFIAYRVANALPLFRNDGEHLTFRGRPTHQMTLWQMMGHVGAASNATTDFDSTTYHEAAGREALVDWLLGLTVTIELRDESLLRLFFADALPREQGLMLLEGRRRGHERYLETLRAIDARPGEDPPFVDLVLRWGIAFNEWGASWCEEQLERLRNETKAA